MPITRLSIDGYGTRRNGSFAGKLETIVEAVATQLGGHFIPQYVTRKIKKRDDLREELLEVLYPDTKIEEVVKSLP